MAEFVQQSIEEMLPELEQMERVGLFTGPETRAILRKRKAYEYKLRRRTKQKEDFLQYIQYEMNLLALIRKRRESTGYKYKRVEIDVAIIRRIHKLFKLVTYRFQDDVKLWLSYIEFCKKRNEKSTISKLYTRMLQVQNRKPPLWILAAKWEMEENASTENARSLLQRGLRFNPKARQLWLEYFRMELLNTDKMRKRRHILGIARVEDVGEENAPDAVLEGQVAHVVYKKALEEIPGDVKFALAFLPIVQIFDFTQNIEKEIYDHLQAFHGNSELTWDAVARKCLHKSPDPPAIEEGEKKKQSQLLWEMYEQCCSVFDKAVEKIKTEAMWTLYLQACMEEMVKRASQKLTQKRIFHTLSVFDRAYKEHLLSETMFEEWNTVLLNTGQLHKAKQVGQLATGQYPTSVAMWTLRLKTCIKTSMPAEEIIAMIKTALENVNGKESLPLWQLSVQWCTLNAPDSVQSLIESGLSMCREVACYTKEQYLGWASLKESVASVRQIYDRLVSTKPISLDFFSCYINIENSQPQPKIKRIRKAFEDALLEFGKSNTELWLEYIKLELVHPKGNCENAGKLHWRAMKTLDGTLTEEFVTQYALLQSGHQ